MAAQGTKKTTVKPAAELKALEAEALGNTIDLVFRGIPLTIDPDDMDDYEAFHQLTQGLPYEVFSLLIPADKQRALLDTCDKNAKSGRPKLSSVVEMMSELIGEVNGGK